MAGFYGADVEQLKALAGDFDKSASTFRTLAQQLNQMVEKSDMWKGNDAERFRAQWRSNLRQQLNNSALALQKEAKALKKNAEEQAQSSNAASGGTGGSSSGSGGGPVSGPGAGPGDSTKVVVKDKDGNPILVDKKWSLLGGNGQTTVTNTSGTDASADGHIKRDGTNLNLDGKADARAGYGAKADTTYQNGPVKFNDTTEGFVGARASTDGKLHLGLDGINGEVHGEAFVGAEVKSTKTTSLADNWLVVTDTNRVMYGAEVKGDGDVRMGPGGMQATGNVEAFAGVRSTDTKEASFLGGLFKVGGETDAKAGAWASAGTPGAGWESGDGGGKWSASGTDAGAGAEAERTQYTEILGQRVGVKGSVAAGAGEGETFDISPQAGGVKIAIGAKLTDVVGLGGGVSVDISAPRALESVTGFGSFVKKQVLG
ncbi:WXG100 family type VII secretion target [Pseudarthrobacter sp. J1738]|uniref:WXG100 family type VII secretion target n=1 Tax=Pseudarthrobacter sp. J1738 TaxID=3420446 RepID=UPI003D2DB839